LAFYGSDRSPRIALQSRCSGGRDDRKNTGGNALADETGSYRTTSRLNLRSGTSTSKSVMLVIPNNAMGTSLNNSQNGFRWQCSVVPTAQIGARSAARAALLALNPSLQPGQFCLLEIELMLDCPQADRGILAIPLIGAVFPAFVQVDDVLLELANVCLQRRNQIGSPLARRSRRGMPIRLWFGCHPLRQQVTQIQSHCVGSSGKLRRKVNNDPFYAVAPTR